ERALRLAPNYTDARRNLAFAQTKIVDNVPVAGSFFLMHWLDKLINLLGSNAWLWLSVAMLVLALLLGFVFLFGKSLIFRKISFYSTIILLVFCFVGGVFSGIQKKRMLNHNEAIVINEVVTVKSAPDKSGTDIFQLHEGTKVTVVDTLGAWTEIRLGNRNTGWLESYLIEKI
ncbi:MAG: SH3 domain-containing protein, partial [Prevotellaceae bacterium]|nr:SH3 domain-containing protein [Prevotellaceae bacterium]